MPTVSFQQGASYKGTIDVTIQQAKPTSAPGSVETLYVDGDAGLTIQALLAFNGLFGDGPGQIPYGATITSATLTIKTVGATADGASLFRMLTDWTERSTWNSFVNGVQTDGVEAAIGPDLTTGAVGLGTQAFDVTASLQAWLSGAASAQEANDANNGWLFSANGIDAWDFKSSEAGTPPLLTVTYTMEGAPPASQLALAGNVTAAEGTSASPTQFVFTVNRTGDSSTAVSVAYAVTGSGSSAAAASDFAGGVLPSGTINFAAGEVSKTIVIAVNADATVESNEGFTVTLSNPTGGAQITGATALGTITNDDASAGTGVLGVRVYETSEFGDGYSGSSANRHGSVDPTDIAYDWNTGSFFVSDSEVDESPFFAGNNLFKVDGDIDLQQGISLRGFSNEPTGLTVWTDPVTGQTLLFIADDDLQRIFVVDAANPTQVIRSFSTVAFGCADPEDLSINPLNGNLFVLSENNRKIMEVTQDGALVRTISLPSKITTPEGLVYDYVNNQFFVTTGKSPDIYVVSTAGVITDTLTVLRGYPNDGGITVKPKGLELAPSSDGSGHLSLWVTDYGKDQVADGRIFEIILDRPATPPAAPLAASAVDQVESGASTIIALASVDRVAEDQLRSASNAHAGPAFVAAVAAAGLMAVPAAAESPARADEGAVIPGTSPPVGRDVAADASAGNGPVRILPVEIREALEEGGAAHARSVGQDAPHVAEANDLAGGHALPPAALAALLHGGNAPAHSASAANALVADAVAMPSAEMLQGMLPGEAAHGAEVAKSTGEVSRALADALSGGGDNPLDALLDALPGNAHDHAAALEAIASHAAAATAAGNAGHLALFGSAQLAFSAEALTVHHDAPPQA